MDATSTEGAKASSCSRVVLAFAGDVIAHRTLVDLAAAASGGWRDIVAGARSAVAGADLALVNVESPVTDRTARRGDMIFRADEALLGSLRAVGFDVASFANNHVYDQGRAGFVDSIAALDRAGFAVVGAGETLRDACAPRVFERNGLRVAILARTLVLNFADHGAENEADVCMLAEGPLKKHAADARRAGADVVVASLHWGNEYERAPREEQIDAAHRVVDAGVDLVVGHHPHVLQRVERRRARDGREALVAYSLGNFVSNQGADFDETKGPPRDGDVRDGAVLRVTLTKSAGHVAIEDVAAAPLWTARDAKTGAIAVGIAPEGPRRDRVRATLGVPLVGDRAASSSATETATAVGTPSAKAARSR